MTEQDERSSITRREFLDRTVAGTTTLGPSSPTRMNGYPDDVTFNPDRLLHPQRRVGTKGDRVHRIERCFFNEVLLF
jgi:hypothetical protein